MSEERSRRDPNAPQTPARRGRDDNINSVPAARDDRDGAGRGRAPREEPDVLLDVSELEVDKITLEVVGLRAHVSVLAQLANLVNLQGGVDARLNRVNLVIEGADEGALAGVARQRSRHPREGS